MFGKGDPRGFAVTDIWFYQGAADNQLDPGFSCEGDSRSN